MLICWLQNRSGQGELLDVDYEVLSPMQLYRAFDLPLKNREVV